VASRADEIVTARERRRAGCAGQLTHHSAQPAAQPVPYDRRAGAARNGERHPRRAVLPIEEIADFEYAMADDSTVPTEPLKCLRGSDSPDQADNL